MRTHDTLGGIRLFFDTGFLILFEILALYPVQMVPEMNSQSNKVVLGHVFYYYQGRKVTNDGPNRIRLALS